MTSHLKQLRKMVAMSGQNNCFYEEIWKIIPTLGVAVVDKMIDWQSRDCRIDQPLLWSFEGDFKTKVP